MRSFLDACQKIVYIKYLKERGAKVQNNPQNGMSSIRGLSRFFKQPALPGKAPQTKKNSKKILKNKNINKKSQMNQK
jgi:hypothetical protein